MSQHAKQYIHFSFDDVCHCIKDLSDHSHDYHSVFDHEFFGWLKEMHDSYGVVFSLYTFNQFTKDPSYHISNLPDTYAHEFEENAHWLKFGFHAVDDLKKYNTDEPDAIKSDYETFLAAICHAANHCTNIIDRIPRLGFCAGTAANIAALRDMEHGIKGLLGADDNRLLYYFGEEETAAMIQAGELIRDELLFLRSQTRMESVRSLEALRAQILSYTEPQIIELFTHEDCWYYPNSKVEGYHIRQLLEYFIKWTYENGYGFEFAQNLYNI